MTSYTLYIFILIYQYVNMLISSTLCTCFLCLIDMGSLQCPKGGLLESYLRSGLKESESLCLGGLGGLAALMVLCVTF